MSLSDQRNAELRSKVQHMMSVSQNRPMAAAGSMIASMAIIGVIDIWVAVIAETISVWQFLVIRMVLAVPVVLLLSAIGFGSVFPKNFAAVAIRSGLIATGMFCYFGALAFMPIAMALAGLFTSPIFVLIATAYGLRQRIGPWRILAVAMGFVGILIVLGPSGGALGWIMVLPVAGGLLYACGVVATRAFCEGEETLTLLIGIFLAQGALGSVVLVGITILQPEVGEGGMAFLTRGWVWPLDAVWPYLFVQVFGSVLGVGLLNKAYQLGEASHVAVFEYTIMVSGPLAAWVFLDQTIGTSQIFGIAFVVLAGVIIAIRSRNGET